MIGWCDSDKGRGSTPSPYSWWLQQWLRCVPGCGWGSRQVSVSVGITPSPILCL